MNHDYETGVALSDSVNKTYGSLSGSHARFFRIRFGKSPEAPPGGEITITSYTVCNKTSLFQKLCSTDKKLLCITIMKAWLLSNLKKTANINSKNLSVYKCC